MLFRVAADTGPVAEGQDARFAVARLAEDDVGLLRARHAKDVTVAAEEFLDATVPWVQVYDGRPESVLRRTAGPRTDKLAGRRILLLGGGGLGAADRGALRAIGAARLHIVDSGR